MMEKEQKETIIKIAVTVLLGAGAFVLTKTGAGDFIFGKIESETVRFIVTLVLWLIPYLIISFEVLKETAGNILHGKFFDEDFLMTVATIGAIVIGEYTEAVGVMVLFAVGELFEDMAEEKSRKSIQELMDLRPDSAVVIREGVEEIVSPEKVEKGEIILVKPGERIPLDGEIVEGAGSINTVAITGESLPVDRKTGDRVFSGSVNINGLLKIRTESEYGDSTVNKIIELVENSAEKKTKAEKRITKFSKVYTPAVVGAAVVLAIVPSVITGNWYEWVYRALTFLMISCPCAFVISVPLTFFAAIGGASRKGILVKGSDSLDMMTTVDTVVFDKTGTLTKGNFVVEDIHPENISVAELLDITALAESYSSHPVADSIQAAHNGHIDKTLIGSVEEIPGKGIRAEIKGKIYYVGNDSLMDSVGAKWHECHLVGTTVHVSEGSTYLGHIIINDEVKKESKEAVTALKRLGVGKTSMLTGDSNKVAKTVAERTGIDEYRAELLPGDKLDEAEKYMEEGRKICFVGDGINDAPVLTRAHVGIAMGAMGSDAAIEAADIVIMDDDISKVPEVIKIAKRAVRIANENIIFTVTAKILILALCGLGIAGMWVAVIGDVGVLILAVLNALRAGKK